jgi:hypothetical protein
MQNSEIALNSGSKKTETAVVNSLFFSGFMFAKQMLFTMSYTSSPVFFGYFGDGIS